MVWYFNNLICFHILSILDNCTLAPIWVKKMPKKDAEELALKTFRKSSNIDQAQKYPGQLSWRSTTKSSYSSCTLYGAKNNAF